VGKKILLGTVVGSVIVFIVSSIIHMALGLGEVGIKTLPAEETILSAMRASIHESGLYFYPGIASGVAPNKASAAEQADYQQRYKRGPTGIVIYNTGGEELNFPKLLIGQFLFGLMGAFLLSWVLAATASATTFWTRVGIVIAATLFAGFLYDLPYWNWYAFPTNYITGHVVTNTITWAIGGLGMVKVT
jgi:hypothetical protein